MSKNELFRITKYEKAKILGVRAQQLSEGSKPMVKVEGLTDVMDIAKKELNEYVLPFTIRRNYPNGSYIDVKVSEMVIN